MATPRKRGSKRTTAVGANASAAVASSANRDVLTEVDLDEGMSQIRDDGSDMMMQGSANVQNGTDLGGIDTLVSTAISDGGESGGLVEETDSAFAWSVPDSTPRLRRAAAFEHDAAEVQSFALDVVATEPPLEILRPTNAVPTATNEPETRVIAIRKHKSRETVETSVAAAVATQRSTPDEVGSPEFMRPRVGADANDRDQFSQRRSFEGVDPLTQRLGCRWFMDAARFDWCRVGPFNLNPSSELDSRDRYVFTRWYQMDRIIVDVFRGDSDRVRREIAEKIESIKAHAITEGRPMGYLPCVRGAFVPDEVIAAVKRGEIVPFQLAQMRQEVAV